MNISINKNQNQNQNQMKKTVETQTECETDNESNIEFVRKLIIHNLFIFSDGFNKLLQNNIWYQEQCTFASVDAHGTYTNIN